MRFNQARIYALPSEPAGCTFMGKIDPCLHSQHLAQIEATGFGALVHPIHLGKGDGQDFIFGPTRQAQGTFQTKAHAYTATDIAPCIHLNDQIKAQRDELAVFQAFLAADAQSNHP